MKARTILLGAALLTSAVTAGEEKPTLANPDILFILIDSPGVRMFLIGLVLS